MESFPLVSAAVSLSPGLQGVWQGLVHCFAFHIAPWGLVGVILVRLQNRGFGTLALAFVSLASWLVYTSLGVPEGWLWLVDTSIIFILHWVGVVESSRVMLFLCLGVPAFAIPWASSWGAVVCALSRAYRLFYSQQTAELDVAWGLATASAMFSWLLTSGRAYFYPHPTWTDTILAMFGWGSQGLTVVDLIYYTACAVPGILSLIAYWLQLRSFLP